MTDKQLERGNQIKKELNEIDGLHAVGEFYLFQNGAPQINTLFPVIEKMAINLNKRIDKLVTDRLTALKKEFAKL